MNSSISFLVLLFINFFIPYSTYTGHIIADIPHNDVKNWASKLGQNLHAYADDITNANHVETVFMDAAKNNQIQRKDGLRMVTAYANEMKSFINLKKLALVNMVEMLENAAQYVHVYGHEKATVPECNQLNRVKTVRKPPDDEFKMALHENRNFGFNRVNTSYACLLRIPNLSPGENAQIDSELRWLKNLKKTFIANYKRDPSLHWQYFGLSIGALYKYPALRQSSIRGKNVLSDFRIDDWYVGGATNPKDIVILLDVSDSISAESRKLTSSIACAIIDTLGINDFVNVLLLDNKVDPVVPCFKTELIQATYNNKNKLKTAIKSAKRGSSSEIAVALNKAFSILQNYNESLNGTQCNQAVLIVTTQLTSRYESILLKYNGDHKLVRVFTYLIGSKGSHEDMKFLGCDNRGYYSFIDNENEISREVSNYVHVMSRPMVMYKNEHNMHFTPVFLGENTRTARILGVAAVDVSIDEMMKIVPPYELGVLGYTFLLDNNGHVVYHPDLQPMPQDQNYAASLKPTYHSVDFAEVEMTENIIMFNETFSKIPEDDLQSARNGMVARNTTYQNVWRRIPYDNMKRVSSREYTYSYHPIEDTPYTLAIALPCAYESLQLIAEEDIIYHKKTHDSGYIAEVRAAFEGDKWKVHPYWIYCQPYFNNVNETAEGQFKYFLEKVIRMENWDWKEIYPNESNTYSWILPTKDVEPYYCDESLFRKALFDAMATKGFENFTERSEDGTRNRIWKQGFQPFGFTTTFVSTRSGFTRWHDHIPVNKNGVITRNADLEPVNPHFSKGNSHSIDELWYKQAIDSHVHKVGSYSYSIPYDAGLDPNKAVITGTTGIFIQNENKLEVPVAVVGLQFKYRKLFKHFKNVTSTCSNGNCTRPCSSTDLDCYVLDNHGYIFISENPTEIGKFFGTVDGTVMESLVQYNIYRRLTVYNHQAKCPKATSHSVDAGSTLMTPFKFIFSMFNWIIPYISLTTQHSLNNLHRLGKPKKSHKHHKKGRKQAANIGFMDLVEEYTEKIRIRHQSRNIRHTFEGVNHKKYWNEVTTEKPGLKMNFSTTSTMSPEEEEEMKIRYPPSYVPSPHKLEKSEEFLMNSAYSRRCTQSAILYNSQPLGYRTRGFTHEPIKGKIANCNPTGCDRRFSAMHLEHSNLIFLAIEGNCRCDTQQNFTLEPVEVPLNENCTSELKPPYRKRPKQCINYHPEEFSTIDECGSASLSYIGYITQMTMIFLVIIIQ